MKRFRLLLLLLTAFLIVFGMLLFFVFHNNESKSVFVNTSLKHLKRPYITTEHIQKEANTLEELLDLDEISIEQLLANPKLSAELLKAEKLTDIIDSRKAITNLRALSESADELSSYIGDDSKLLASINKKRDLLAKKTVSPDWKRKPGMIDSGILLNVGISGFNLKFVKDTNQIVKTSDNSLQLLAAGDMKNELDRINNKLDKLLAPPVLGNGKINPSIDFKGTWTKPDKVILRWTPHGDWIPENGYSLYRVVAGKAQLIAEGIGSPQLIDAAAQKNMEFSEYIKSVFAEATLTSEKMAVLGISNKKDFYNLKGTSGILNSQRARIKGDEDYSRLKENLITVPATMDEKLPSIDAIKVRALHLQDEMKPQIFSIADLEFNTISSMGLKMAVLPETQTSPKDELKSKVLEARKAILSKAFVDDEFAIQAGLGFEDDLTDDNLEEGIGIRYVLVAVSPDITAPIENNIISGQEMPGMKVLTIKKGEEQVVEKPKGLEGYGIDNTVSLRWDSATLDYDKSIISGYYIERKMKGEISFKRISNTPIAISYTLDESGIYFETPVFYIDNDIKNDEKAAYRIQALDIFGRISQYSDELELTVYKVTPPNSPNLGQPVLSSNSGKLIEAYQRRMTELNTGKKGIILPVVIASDDTDSIVIFRSKALGTGFFDTPEEIIRLDTGDLSDTRERVISLGKSRMLMHPKSETRADIVFFDKNVEQGFFYKYWAAAVDRTGNESAWSSSRILGVPLDELPEKPGELSAAMKRNSLIDPSKAAAGFGVGITARNAANAMKKLPSADSASMMNIADDVILAAKKDGAEVGVSISDIKKGIAMPAQVSSIYGNLPDLDYVHDIAAFENKDLLPDGSAKVSWYHNSSGGLAGYHVYRTYVEGKTIKELQAMTRAELTESNTWKLVSENVEQNQIIDNTLEKKDGRIYLYLICLAPEKSDDIKDPGFDSFEPGGWIFLNWEKPGDPQVSCYRVYRSEVPFFADNQDTSVLEWTLVGDRLEYTKYSEKVDQTFAHYYYFKVTSISIWGGESETGSITKIRVPATTPPQTPSMLLPLSKKGAVQINWAGVPHASKYIIYRNTLPKIKEEDILKLQSTSRNLYNSLFLSQAAGDNFVQSKFSIKSSMLSIIPKADTPILSTDKFNTLQNVSKRRVLLSVKDVSSSEKAAVFKDISDKYGPLALMPYGSLSAEAAKLVLWEKVGEVEIPQGQESTGQKSFTDDSVQFGNTYLYTVQAENDDKLGSGRPDPVSASQRKNAPFEPVDGLKCIMKNGKPELTWNHAKDANLTWLQSREYVAGYIVYRSTSKDGSYYQASPLLSEASWVDENSGLFAENWYKVKVIDTAGYISGFSSAVNIKLNAGFILKSDEKETIVPSTINKGFSNRGQIYTAPAPDRIIIPTDKPPIIVLPRPTPAPTPTPPARSSPATNDTPSLGASAPATKIAEPAKASSPLEMQVKLLDYVTICDFIVTDLKLNYKTDGSKVGTGNIIIAGNYKAEVNLSISELAGKKVTRGTAALIKAAEFKSSGITISRFTANPAVGKAVADGYVIASSRRTIQGQENLMGDLYSMPFKNSKITPNGNITINEVPVFHYGNLTFEKVESAAITIADDVRGSSGYIKLFNGTVQNNLGLETVDNVGLRYTYTDVAFDRDGLLTGAMKLKEMQTMRLVIPAGLGLKAYSSSLSFSKGEADKSVSFISGAVLLPFKTFDDKLPADLSLSSFAKINAVQAIDIKGIKDLGASGSAKLSIRQNNILDESMLYMAERIQDYSLLILPVDLKVQETLSSVVFQINDWNGGGFMIKDKAMTPALVGNCQEETGDEMGVTPGKVSVDLDRENALGQEGPADTKNKDWTGILVKNGVVSLPPSIIMTENNGRIRFKLTEGELLYDRNGISYQNLSYSQQGIPANLGDKLGGFMDIKVFDSMIDIYGNKVNVEINGEMGIPLFNYDKVKIRIYTSKVTGKIVCSVAETELDPSKSGELKIKIFGGYLLEDGLHMNGSLNFNFPDKLVMPDVKFNELIVPSNMELMTSEGNKDGKYGKALFDKPYSIKFHDFNMEIRALSILSKKETVNISLAPKLYADGEKYTLKLKGIEVSQLKSVDFYQSNLTLWGGMQLSDNLTLDANEDFDRLAISKAFSNPDISYNESISKLRLNFEEFVTVNSVVTPVVTSEDNSIIEYETEELNMLFDAANSLTESAVQAKVRMGYDREHKRSFFVLGTYYNDPNGGIDYKYGHVNKIQGIFGYNIDMEKGQDNRFVIPKGDSALFDSVDNMKVSRKEEGNYFFAMSGVMSIGFTIQGYSLTVGEVRDLYLVVERGPNVETGGDFWAPTDVVSLVAEKDYKLLGHSQFGYYHPDRWMNCSVNLYDVEMYNFTLSGDLGFDICPKFWEFRVGYPEILNADVNGLFDVGFGIKFRSSDIPDDSYIRARVAGSFDTGDITISPIYVRAYLYAGAEGQYYFDQKLFNLDVYLRGGVEGGIKAFGKRYAIIHLMMDANGKLSNGGGNWNLNADVGIHYSLDLWLDEIEGSVNWHISRSF